MLSPLLMGRPRRYHETVERGSMMSTKDMTSLLVLIAVVVAGVFVAEWLKGQMAKES